MMLLQRNLRFFGAITYLLNFLLSAAWCASAEMESQGNLVKKICLTFGDEPFIFFSHSAWILVGGIKTETIFPIRKTVSYIGIHQ